MTRAWSRRTRSQRGREVYTRRMKNLSQAEHYTYMDRLLNERQWRLYVAAEAKRIGVGGISQIAREAGVSRKTIRKGIRELEAGKLYQPGGGKGREGGGGKNSLQKDERVRSTLESCD